jgi:hypothetical protein
LLIVPLTALFLQGKLLNIADLSNARVMQTIQLPGNTGPHATVLAPGDKLLAISTYYLQNPESEALPAVTSDKEKNIRLFTVADDGNSFAPDPVVPVVEFRNMFPHRGVARPHGMAFKPVPAS